MTAADSDEAERSPIASTSITALRAGLTPDRLAVPGAATTAASLSPPPGPLRRAASLPARVHPTPADSLPAYPPRRASTGDATRPHHRFASASVHPVGSLTPALAVRASLLSRVMHGYMGLGVDTRYALALKLVLVCGQTIAFSVVLGLTANQDCDRPLRTYLAVHIVRATLSYILGFYVSLLPPVPAANDAVSPEVRAALEARRVMGTERWDRRIKLASDLLLLFALAWFVVGNVYLFNSHTCHNTSPGLYYSSLVALVIGYIYLAEVVVIVIAIVFFLPLAVLLLTAMGYGQKKHDVAPLAQADIDAIPLVLFTPLEEGDDAAAAAAPPPPGDGETAVEPVETVDAEPEPTTKPLAAPVRSLPPRRARFSRLFYAKRRSRKTPGQATDGQHGRALPYPLHPLPENLSTCPICLTDFEPPPSSTSPSASPAQGEAAEEPAYDILRLLPACGHCLHRDCLDPWLRTSGRCPVCQTPVKPQDGKKKRRQSTAAAPGATTRDAHDVSATPADANV